MTLHVDGEWLQHPPTLGVFHYEQAVPTHGRTMFFSTGALLKVLEDFGERDDLEKVWRRVSVAHVNRPENVAPPCDCNSTSTPKGQLNGQCDGQSDTSSENDVALCSADGALSMQQDHHISYHHVYNEQGPVWHKVISKHPITNECTINFEQDSEEFAIT